MFIARRIAKALSEKFSHDQPALGDRQIRIYRPSPRYSATRAGERGHWNLPLALRVNYSGAGCWKSVRLTQPAGSFSPFM